MTKSRPLWLHGREDEVKRCPRCSSRYLTDEVMELGNETLGDTTLPLASGTVDLVSESYHGKEYVLSRKRCGSGELGWRLAEDSLPVPPRRRAPCSTWSIQRGKSTSQKQNASIGHSGKPCESEFPVNPGSTSATPVERAHARDAGGS